MYVNHCADILALASYTHILLESIPYWAVNFLLSFDLIYLSKFTIFSGIGEDLPKEYPKILHQYDVWHWIKVRLRFNVFSSSLI